MLGMTALIYAMIFIFERLFREKFKNSIVKLSFTVNGIKTECIGKIDTGCDLNEPFSSAPVIIADKSVFSDIDNTKTRVIPYSAIGISSVLFAQKADEVIINNKKIDKDIYIASGEVESSAFQAIINSEITRWI